MSLSCIDWSRDTRLGVYFAPVMLLKAEDGIHAWKEFYACIQPSTEGILLENK